MKPSKIKQMTTLAQTAFLNLYDYAYDNKLGEPKHWIVASRKKRDVLEGQFFEGKEEQVDAIVVVAVHDTTNELVLVKQYRAPIDAYVYELPAGLVDQGELPEEAVRRELKEETGLTVVEIDQTRGRNKVYLSPGMSDESVSLVYCKCTGEVSTAFLEADEEITPLLLSKEAAQAILESDENLDIKAYIILSEYVKGTLN